MNNTVTTNLQNAPLAEQVTWWSQHQIHPAFVAVGIFNSGPAPEDYWTVQHVLSGGPKSWAENWEILRNNRMASKDNNLSTLSEALLESVAAPWRKVHEEAGWRIPDSAGELVRLAESFFESFFDYLKEGYEAAITYLAMDNRDEKSSRRCPWFLNVLNLLLPTADGRVEVLVHSTATSQEAGVRRRAMRWLPLRIPPTAELQRFLLGFGDEADAVVRYWAASHLSHTARFPEISARPDWLGKALRHGLSNKGVSGGFDAYDDHIHEPVLQTAKLLSNLGFQVMQDTVLQLDSGGNSDARTWYHILARLAVEHGDSGRNFVSDFKRRWETEKVSNESMEIWGRFCLWFSCLIKAMDHLNPYRCPDVSGRRSAWVYSADECRLTIVDAMEDPRGLIRVRGQLRKEFECQKLLPGVDAPRLAQVEKLLSESNLPERDPEINALVQTLTQITPWAMAQVICDRYLQEEDFSGLYGTLE